MEPSAYSPPNISVLPSEVTFLNTYLEHEVQRYRALVELSNLTSAASQTPNPQPLVERLHEYPSGGVDLGNLVQYPPKLEPIPVKPLFFDAAWNYIEYPGRQVEATPVTKPAVAKKSNEVEQTAEEKKKGWFGFGR